MQIDAIFVVTKNSYSFENNLFKWTYPNANTIDSIIPINEKVNARKLLQKRFVTKNKKTLSVKELVLFEENISLS